MTYYVIYIISFFPLKNSKKIILISQNNFIMIPPPPMSIYNYLTRHIFSKLMCRFHFKIKYRSIKKIYLFFNKLPASLISFGTVISIYSKIVEATFVKSPFSFKEIFSSVIRKGTKLVVWVVIGFP